MNKYRETISIDLVWTVPQIWLPQGETMISGYVMCVGTQLYKKLVILDCDCPVRNPTWSCRYRSISSYFFMNEITSTSQVYWRWTVDCGHHHWLCGPQSFLPSLRNARRNACRNAARKVKSTPCMRASDERPSTRLHCVVKSWVASEGSLSRLSTLDTGFLVQYMLPSKYPWI